ncbi:hypothetical protein MLD38_010240 [Melastoma candidum]|uniref:Uncharacterized protein n=2 Tax=Melastoma candidum TaxID=119954 RepID=A0ACB9QZ75_9MYRT|nr:hypothetical protein MLD38_010240 [Melastoma candidum]
MGYGSCGKASLQGMRVSPWIDDEERAVPRRRGRGYAGDDDEEAALNVENLHEILDNLSVRMDAMAERFTAQFDDMAHQIELWRDEVKPICCIVCDFFAQNPDLVVGSIGRTTLQNMNVVKEDDTWLRLNPRGGEEGEAPDMERGRHVEQDAVEAPNVENLQQRVHNLSLRANALEGHLRAQLDGLDRQIKILGHVKLICRHVSDFISQNPGFLPLLNK